MWDKFFDRQFGQKTVCEVCGIEPGRLQHWVNRGHFIYNFESEQHKRRLYSSCDIFIIMTMFGLSRLGVPINTIGEISLGLNRFFNQDDREKALHTIRQSAKALLVYVDDKNKVRFTFANDFRKDADVWLCVHVGRILQSMQSHRTLGTSR